MGLFKLKKIPSKPQGGSASYERSKRTDRKGEKDLFLLGKVLGPPGV